MPSSLQTFAQLLWKTAQAWVQDRATRLGAALAFYSAFSLAPILMVAIAMIGLFFGEEAARGLIERQLSSIMGPKAAGTIEGVLSNADKSGNDGIMALVGILILLFSASGVFVQLKDSLNTIWQIKVQPGHSIRDFLRDRFLSIAMVVVFGFLLLVSLTVSTIMTGMAEWLGAHLPVPAAALPAIDILTSLVVITLLFAAVFKLLPDAQVPWRHVWGGAVLSSLLFMAGKYALALYLSQATVISTYGAAGALVLILMWVYYSAIVLLFGAEFTQVYSRHTGHHIEPAPYAVKVAQVEVRFEGTPPGEKPEHSGGD